MNTAVRDVEGYLELGRMLDRGYTLPDHWYTRPDVFELELRRIFLRSWQFVGLTHRVPNPHDFITARAGQAPVVVTRDEEGELHAFVNVCRHRGSKLVHEAAGNQKSLQCRYHAWTYGLDGSLRAAPGERESEGFDRDAFHLRPVQVASWGPFIFVNPDLEAQSLPTTLGALPALVENTGVDLDLIQPRVSRQYMVGANWKVVVDNYLECYHCRVAHPSFCDLIDLDHYTVTEYDLFSTQTAPVRAARARAYEAGSGVTDGFYAYLWPNFTINIYPGPGNVSLNLFLPIDVNHTLALFDYCFVDSVKEQEIADFAAFVDQVQVEDTGLCESVQSGLQSNLFGQGKLMMPQETALRHFQKLVHGSLAPER